MIQLIQYRIQQWLSAPSLKEQLFEERARRRSLETRVTELLAERDILRGELATARAMETQAYRETIDLTTNMLRPNRTESSEKRQTLPRYIDALTAQDLAAEWLEEQEQLARVKSDGDDTDTDE